MSKKILKRNPTPGGPLPREDNRSWINKPLSEPDKSLGESVVADVLDGMRHLPSDELTFAVCWQRFLEEMTAASPNWGVFTGKPRQQLGKRGNAMYMHVYYRWQRFSFQPASSVDEGSPVGSPHKNLTQSPGSFGLRPTTARSPDPPASQSSPDPTQSPAQ